MRSCRIWRKVIWPTQHDLVSAKLAIQQHWSLAHARTVPPQHAGTSAGVPSAAQSMQLSGIEISPFFPAAHKLVMALVFPVLSQATKCTHYSPELWPIIISMIQSFSRRMMMKICKLVHIHVLPPSPRDLTEFRGGSGLKTDAPSLPTPSAKFREHLSTS